MVYDIMCVVAVAQQCSRTATAMLCVYVVCCLLTFHQAAPSQIWSSYHRQQHWDDSDDDDDDDDDADDNDDDDDDDDDDHDHYRDHVEPIIEEYL